MDFPVKNFTEALPQDLETAAFRVDNAFQRFKNSLSQLRTRDGILQNTLRPETAIRPFAFENPRDGVNLLASHVAALNVVAPGVTHAQDTLLGVVDTCNNKKTVYSTPAKARLAHGETRLDHRRILGRICQICWVRPGSLLCGPCSKFLCGPCAVQTHSDGPEARHEVMLAPMVEGAGELPTAENVKRLEATKAERAAQYIVRRSTSTLDELLEEPAKLLDFRSLPDPDHDLPPPHNLALDPKLELCVCQLLFDSLSELLLVKIIPTDLL